MTSVHVGIDLGTTYSLVAVVTDGTPRVLPNALGEFLTPSAVCVSDDGVVLVGGAARAWAGTHPDRTALAFKRDMGTDRSFTLGARSFSPEELSSLVLGELKRDAESALGQSVDEAVVTVPAHFGELQRRATRDACELAGLHVERIIDEPTAAALAYGLHHRNRELRAVVLNLGGGTFDVTVLQILEGTIEIQASAGDSRLGGEDFADLVVEHCLARVRECHGVEVDAGVGRARLREAAEVAKRRLSKEEFVTIALFGLPTSGGPLDLELPLPRSELEAAVTPLLQRVRASIERALRDCGTSAERIDEVLLVGGATRMPCVGRLVAELFGRSPERTLPPDEAVALGAAVQAALKPGDAGVSDFVTTDVAPFGLGTYPGHRVGSANVRDIFSPIVVPSAPAGAQAIDVRLSYDVNRVLGVDATVLSTGETPTFTVERAPGRLSPAELALARKRLGALAFHPRDALPNVTALARADSHYVELVGPARARLGACIADFRVALETRDKDVITRERERLLALLAELSHRID